MQETGLPFPTWSLTDSRTVPRLRVRDATVTHPGAPETWAGRSLAAPRTPPPPERAPVARSVWEGSGQRRSQTPTHERRPPIPGELTLPIPGLRTCVGPPSGTPTPSTRP